MEPDKEATFEESLHQLERVVDELERGTPELSRALGKYEEGVRLLARCQGVLEQAERSVALLTGVDAQGNPVSTPFDATATVEADTPAQPAPPRARKSNPRSTDPPF